ncbi:MAG: sulfite exporter TauE/SafE family protein [Mycobacteriaceae bacterium]
MPLSEIILITVAGLAAGIINSVVGSGTLITFPTLLAFGVPPVTATMSNAVGLVAGGVSGTWAYRKELHGQRDRLRWQIPASLAGAVTGSLLLLSLPEKMFLNIVPVLLVLALMLVVTQTKIQHWARTRSERLGRNHSRLTSKQLFFLTAGTFLVGIYGGYFTAAQGILLIGVMGALLPDTIQKINAGKNLLTTLVNIVAAIVYMCIAPDRIDWHVAGLIAAGSLCGGFVGAKAAQKLPPTALRGAIVLIGLIGLWRLTTA